ncbi:hypothetical protein EDC01DRAFT_650396 [Geopyxis carbonaria]|nr:hypothetical protein EDC01DRAFT_650396 [Geopyxis carbonaria]
MWVLVVERRGRMRVLVAARGRTIFRGLCRGSLVRGRGGLRVVVRVSIVVWLLSTGMERRGRLPYIRLPILLVLVVSILALRVLVWRSVVECPLWIVVATGMRMDGWGDEARGKTEETVRFCKPFQLQKETFSKDRKLHGSRRHNLSRQPVRA